MRLLSKNFWGFLVCRDPEVTATLRQLKREVRKMSKEFDRLKTEVSEMTLAVKEATDKLTELATEIRENVDDPEVLNELADELDAAQAAIAEAVGSADEEFVVE